MPSLDGVDAKIARAREHLRIFHDQAQEVFARDRYRFEFDQQQEDRKYAYRVYGVPEIPGEWNLMIGDFLHNLRSALDHLAWQLVLLDGGLPTSRTQFPIWESPFDRDGAWRGAKIDPVIKDERIQDLLEGVQPYFEGRRPANSDESYLWVLRKLSNIDKHRLLVVVASVLDPGQMYWSYTGESPVVGPTLANVASLKDGDPAVWFEFREGSPPSGFDPNAALQEAIREPEVPLIARNSARNALAVMLYVVEDEVVRRFRRLF